MKKFLFLSYMTVVLNSSLVFSMDNQKADETDKSIVHLNTQSSQIENLGMWKDVPDEIKYKVLINYTSENEQSNLRLVCKAFNAIISNEKSNTLSKLLAQKTLINPFGWTGKFKFDRIEDNRVNHSDKGLGLTSSEEFFLNAVAEAIEKKTVQMKVFSKSASPKQYALGIHSKQVAITTFRGVVPSFEEAYPPKDTVDPFTGSIYTSYGPTGHFTVLLVASFLGM